MFLTEIPDGVIAVIVSLGGAFALAFGGWIAREMYRTSSLLARVQEKQDETDRRLANLEAHHPKGS